MSFVVLAMLAAVARADGTCGAWQSAADFDVLTDGQLDEASGVAVSYGGPLLWAHNDRGDEARLFSMGIDGGEIGRVPVTGATHEDWEDIAAGPCDAACSCLYIGDIGDNDGIRAEGVVWRIPEPSPVAPETAPADALRFTYPDGRHDAEALLVDPNTGEIFVVTRTLGPTGVYAFPSAVAGQTVELALVTTLDLSDLGDDGEVTAGDVSPSGDRVVLRTNGDVLMFEGPAGGGIRGALAADPVKLPAPESADGEAIAFSRDGRTLYLVDEGDPAKMWEMTCVDFTDDGVAAPDCGADDEEEDPKGCGCGGGGDSAAMLPLLALLAWRRRKPSA